MSLAGSTAPARHVPGPLKVTFVPPGTATVSTFVNAAPCEGLTDSPAGSIAAAGTARWPPGAAPEAPNSTMTAFSRLRTTGVSGLASSIRTRAISVPSSPVADSTATSATAPDGRSGRTPPGDTLRRSTSSVSGSGCAAT